MTAETKAPEWTTRPASILCGVHVGWDIRHPKAGKGTLINGKWERPGQAKITMITHKKNGDVIIRTDFDQQNITFDPTVRVTVRKAERAPTECEETHDA